MPIPARHFDWQATLADRDPGQAQPVGRGVTEAEAVRALLEQIEEEASSFAGGETRPLKLSPEAWRWLDGTVEGATATLVRDEAVARAAGDAGAIRQTVLDSLFAAAVLSVIRGASL